MDTASRRKTDAEGSFLTPSRRLLAKPGTKGSGAPRIEDAAVERRKARPADRKAGRLLAKTAGIPGAPYGALLPLFEGERRKPPLRERANENQD